jgi:phosphoribosyl 1,2-cyclic phosphate phosphodiesterase
MAGMKTKIIVMGCGGSGGVPYAGNVWGKCDPLNPKNHRTRPSVFIECGETRIVIDTGPDFRTQINKTGLADHLDAVLYTHAHVDHILGIDDLRAFWFRAGKKPVPVYGTAETLLGLQTRFDYVFQTLHPSYPAIAEGHILPDVLTIGSLTIKTFRQIHGDSTTQGFRIGDFAYSTDVNDLPEESLAALQGVKVWIVGSHSDEIGAFNHAGFNTIKKWADRLKVEKVFLTHLNAHADYDELNRILPLHIRPAYDGLEFIV